MLSVSREMDFDGDRYYKLNRIFLSVIGLWPHGHITLRQIQATLFSFLLISVTFPQLTKLIVEEYDVDVTVRVLSSALPFMLFTVKYIAFYFVTENIKELMGHIRNDWNALKDYNEIKIINRHAKSSVIVTKSLAKSHMSTDAGSSIARFTSKHLIIIVRMISVLIYMSFIMVMCVQYMPNFLNVVAPLNKSRRAELLFRVEYFVDQEEYYHMIQFHLDVGLMVAATTILATESFCLTVCIHAYGMFKIARYIWYVLVIALLGGGGVPLSLRFCFYSYRTEHIIDTNAPNVFTGKRYVSYDSVVAAVNGHRRAVEFSEIFRTTFVISYLALILLGVTSSSVNLFLLFQVIMSASRMDDIIRSIVYVCCHFLYMFLTNYAAQKFIDHDSEIYEKICSLRWYKAPLQIQRQILFIMRKTARSYHMSVGGLYDPSLEGFTTLASATLSYFTVLCSIRK